MEKRQRRGLIFSLLSFLEDASFRYPAIREQVPLAAVSRRPSAASQ